MVNLTSEFPVGLIAFVKTAFGLNCHDHAMQENLRMQFRQKTKTRRVVNQFLVRPFLQIRIVHQTEQHIQQSLFRKRVVAYFVKKSPHFVDGEGSLYCAQGGPLIPILSHTNPFKILPPYSFKIHFNIILLYKPSFSKWPVPFISFLQYFIQHSADCQN